MLPLDEYQRQMSAWLLAPDSQSKQGPELQIAFDSAGLAVHRNTIFRTLVNALRLTFPTVSRLMGEDAFSKAARQYAQKYPPRSAVLYQYGKSFPEHLRLAAPEFPYLFDIARFDLIIDETGHESPALFAKPIPIAPGTSVRLVTSLHCARFDYAVDAIRDAVDARYAPDRVIECTEGTKRNFAIWRSPASVSVKSLSEPAATFLEGLILGRDPEEVIIRAVEVSDSNRAVEAIRSEVFSSSFCRVVASSAPGASL